jgi:GNAT superfamily N-acetyltransferase
MYDAFISHSSKDKSNYVYKLRDRMEELGCKVWLDEKNIVTGDNILNQIKRGIKDSLCVILILTKQFFNSNWTSLETGLTLSDTSIQIIPVIAGIPNSVIAERLPFLLSTKYLCLSDNNIAKCADELFSAITKLRERHRKIVPLNYPEKVRELNNFDSPGTNKLSILITEYEQICKISIDAGISHASKIAITVIDDLYMRIRRPNDIIEYPSLDKLDALMGRGIGLQQGVYEHLHLLISGLGTQMTPFANDEDKKIMIELSLASILNWYLVYINAFLHRNMNEERIDTVWYNELKFRDFLDMHEIDKLVLRHDLIAPAEVAYKWYQYNNFSHIAVRSSITKKIIGYFTLFPVTDDLYEEIKSGNFKDNNLDTKGIRKYDFPDFYKLYVACVCIHPDYQNTNAFHKLYNSLLKMMYDLATEKEIFITDIITEASTPQGLKLCKILGFRKFLSTSLDTEIYGATLLPPSLRLNSNFGHRLIRFYQDKYTELKDLF